MTKKELRDLAKDFTEIKPLIEKRKKIKVEENKIRRRLLTQERKYQFLMDLVGEKSWGDPLVEAVVKYFKILGFKADNVDKKYKEEDVRLWTKDRLIIIEITGFDNHQTTDDKAHQISKHIPIRASQYPNLKVTGCYIVNHFNTKHYKRRNKDPFRSPLKLIAKSHKYSMFTTVDLLDWFIKIKEEKLTAEWLIEKITTFE